MSLFLQQVSTLRSASFASIIEAAWTDSDEPRLCTVMASRSLRSQTFSRSPERSSRVSAAQGWGIASAPDGALIPAVAEMIERYSAAVLYDEQIIWSRFVDLAGKALDLLKLPRCSERELQSPYCPLREASPIEPIRWVEGTRLRDGTPMLVPAVMVYSHAGWQAPQERFWLPISTGCAAHHSYEQAVLNGLCEVIERDAIAIVWLQQLPLPRIEVDRVGPLAEPYWDSCQRACADISYHFFDATTDVGIPTIYGIQSSRYHPRARTIVACATSLSYDEALAKVIRDLVALKRAFRVPYVPPADVRTFSGLLDGAAYMARSDHAPAFSFLLESKRSVALSSLSKKKQTTLPGLIQTLTELCMTPVVVDLTTDEAIRSELRVVRVLVPELQPFSLHHAARYLAHSRLYTAPLNMGYAVRPEEHLNSWPQPFA